MNIKLEKKTTTVLLGLPFNSFTALLGGGGSVIPSLARNTYMKC